DLDFAKQGGLLPSVVQHAGTGRVLMVGYQDADALTATLATGLATLYSRSRREQWVKGATSGNYLHVTAVQVDCDRDTVLLLCDPDGATCHTGAESCFDAGVDREGTADSAAAVGPFEESLSEAPTGQAGHQGADVGSFLAELEQVVLTRDRERPEGSYTTL